MWNPFKKKQTIEEEITKLKELLDLHAEATNLGITPTSKAKLVGDGKAEFLGLGTEEEYLEQQRKDNGTDKWYKRIGL